jgi:hypothetical protein
MKESKDQLGLFIHRYGILENKYNNSENYIRELKENVKECLEQIIFQDTLKLNSEKYINELEKKIKNLEQEIKNLRIENLEKSKDISKDISNLLITNENINTRNSILNVSSNINNNSMTVKPFNKENIIQSLNKNHSAISKPLIQDVYEEDIKKTELSNPLTTIPNTNNNNLNTNFNKNSDFTILNTNHNMNDPNQVYLDTNIYKNNESVKESIDSATFYKMKEKLNSSQFNQIISERENNKKFITNYIKDSLSFNYNNFQNANINNYEIMHSNTNNKEDFNNNNLNFNRNSNSNFYNNIDDRKIVTFGRQEENKNFTNIKNNPKTVCNIENSLNSEKELIWENSKNFNSNILNSGKKSERKSPEKYEYKDDYKKQNFHNNKYYENKIISTNMDNPNYNKEIKNINDSNKNYDNTINKTSKADKILEIIIKIRTIDDVASIVTHLFGEDILDKLISPNIEDDIVEQVEATIREIERLMQRGILSLCKMQS